MTSEYNRVIKCLEALCRGYELEIDCKRYIVDDDLRVGYVVGDIFYEQSFREFIKDLDLVSNVSYMQVISFLSNSSGSCKYHRAIKCIEAMLLGYIIEYECKRYLIGEDLRVGYIVGEIFYEQSFREIVGQLNIIKDVKFMEVASYLSLLR